MKFKLIQFGILLVIVMSIVYIRQVPNVYGHGTSEHLPEFYVDAWTGKYAGTRPTHMYHVDPRIASYYSKSSGNGTESASSWALRYYPSGVISGDHKSDIEIEMIYGAKVDLSASAGNSSCSGSVSPSVTDDMGLTPDHEGWSGHGRVNLTIPRKSVVFFNVIKSKAIIVGESKRDTLWVNIGITVQPTKETNTQSGEITAGISHGPADASASWEHSTSVEKEGLYAYPKVISASLSVPFWLKIGLVHYQLDKSAIVDGNLSSPVEPSEITALFTPFYDSY